MNDDTPLTAPTRRTTRARATRLLAAMAIAGLLGAACSSGPDDSAAAADNASSSRDAEQPADDDTADADSDDGGSDDSSDDVLATADGQHRADPNDQTMLPLRVDVTALERNGDLVELRITVAHEGDAADPSFKPYSAFDDPRLSTGGMYSLSGAALVDGDAQKAYLTVIDSEGICLCTGGMAQINVPGGGSVDMYADFGGVPDDLEEIDVTIPGFATLADIPIDG
jgi:hypothetical protein